MRRTPQLRHPHPVGAGTGARDAWSFEIVMTAARLTASGDLPDDPTVLAGDGAISGCQHGRRTGWRPRCQQQRCDFGTWHVESPTVKIRTYGRPCAAPRARLSTTTSVPP